MATEMEMEMVTATLIPMAFKFAGLGWIRSLSRVGDGCDGNFRHLIALPSFSWPVDFTCVN